MQQGLLAGSTMGEDSGFTLNRMTGTLYVKARPSKMRAVEKMLAQVHKVLGKQCMRWRRS